MSQKITITVTIDIPAGATVTVGGADAFEDAPWPGSSVAPVSAPVAQRSGPGDCPVHHVPFTWKEGGVSKNGKPYDGFWKCGEKNADDSFCNQRPAR